MIKFTFKRNSAPIDDEDLLSVAATVMPLLAGVDLKPDYVLLIAKLVLRIGELRASAGAVPEGYFLAPIKPTPAILRPFTECPTDELDTAYEAMRWIIGVAVARHASGTEYLKKRGEFYDFLEETSAPATATQLHNANVAATDAIVNPFEDSFVAPITDALARLQAAPICTVCGERFGECGGVRLVPTGFPMFDPTSNSDIPDMDSCERSDCPAAHPSGPMK